MQSAYLVIKGLFQCPMFWTAVVELFNCLPFFSKGSVVIQYKQNHCFRGDFGKRKCLHSPLSEQNIEAIAKILAPTLTPLHNCLLLEDVQTGVRYDNV